MIILIRSSLCFSGYQTMIDPEELPLEEMNLQAKEQPSTPRPSWRELTVYLREVPPAFHTIPDYQAALSFFTLGYPKVQQILND